MKKQMAIWKQFLVVALLCGAGLAVWTQREEIAQATGIALSAKGERHGRRGGGENKVPVIVDPVREVQLVDMIQSIGSGRANRSVTIFPEVSGTVTDANIEAGKRVKHGDVLLKLDDAQTKLSVQLAQTKLADAKRTLERNLTLLPRKAVAEVTVDTSRTAVETAELELKQAQELLADRTILAPFDGVLGITQVERGDRVSETTAITTIDDRSVIIVEFDVPEIYLKRLKLGQKITATTAGFRGQAFDGEVTQIDSRVDTGTRAVHVRAALRNPSDVLRGGMSFSVSMTLEGDTYPSIAELALLWEREGAYVWRIAEGKAERVTVSVVKRAEGRVLVDAPLKQGQLVVAEGTQRLRPGREVSFDEPAAAGGEKAGL